MQSGWLGCLSSKTGLPKVLLTFAIFLSALGMIWLAFSTTVTASEQRITTQPQVLVFHAEFTVGTDTLVVFVLCILYDVITSFRDSQDQKWAFLGLH